MQPIDKQSLLDSGILCCLIHILNSLLDSGKANQRDKAINKEEQWQPENLYDGDVQQGRRLEVASSSQLLTLMCSVTFSRIFPYFWHVFPTSKQKRGQQEV